MQEQRKSMWSWFIQRLTGLYLIFGMAVHMWILPLRGEKITFDTVAQRLQYPGWFVFDMLLLGCCLYHGFNGVWAVVADFNPQGKPGRMIMLGLIALGLFLLVYGIFVLFPLSK